MHFILFRLEYIVLQTNEITTSRGLHTCMSRAKQGESRCGEGKVRKGTEIVLQTGHQRDIIRIHCMAYHLSSVFVLMAS